MTPNVPDTFREALVSIQDRAFLATRRHREQHWRADRNGGDPQILLFERMLVRRLANVGVPFFASEVMRTRERQAALKAEGRSQLLSGPHMAGMAVDLVHGLKGWEIDRKAWALVGHIGKEIIAQEGLRIVWGGDWKTFWDPAHWERADWRNVPSELVPF